ncbi:hypothetical protein BJX61DRAFT_495112 [Aspergillus egyptiacus]|nr:hypothetical protein BJX61DRAFT_495112 [Aspergillus egyptiacus]
MAWPRLYVLSGVTAGAALFTTLLALWRPRGYQPACWGNLQTLADLVDEWCDWEGRLWWGEKGVVSPDREVWHAGTCSSRRLDPVCKDKVYS